MKLFQSKKNYYGYIADAFNEGKSNSFAFSMSPIYVNGSAATIISTLWPTDWV